MSLGKVAKLYKLSKATIGRHKTNCLVPAVGKAEMEASKDTKDKLELSSKGAVAWHKLEDMMKDLKDLQDDAKTKKDIKGAIASIREQSRIYELIMKMMIAAREAEDPYEKRYNDLAQELHQLCGIISSALVGSPKMRDKILNEINRITA